jgi:hypothetical protein
MKNQLVILGIVALFVCVGLSGCSGLGTTSIKDIRDHPNRYINQTVTLQGTYQYMSVYDNSGGILCLVIPSDVKQPTPFVFYSEYKFTGIVRYSNNMIYSATGGLYLEVTRIETT